MSSAENNFLKLIKKLNNSHDLETLPQWGPYTKKYIGTSHITDKINGLRFDLSIFPGYYRRRVDVPNVFYETEYYPWDTSTDGTYFKFRHMLEWKDKVYCDISYFLIDDNTQAIKAKFVNNTSNSESLVLHLMGSMHFPSIKEYEPNNLLYPSTIALSGEAQWIDATDYYNLSYSIPKPTDNLVADGKLRGERRTQNFVNGSGIEFGKVKDDQIIFKFNIEDSINKPTLLLKYKLEKNSSLKLTISNNDKDNLFECDLLLENESEFKDVELPNLEIGDYFLKLSSTNNRAINLDGFIVGSHDDVHKSRFHQQNWNPTPQISKFGNNSIILKYQNTEKYYGIFWDYPLEDCDIREFFCRDLDIYFKLMANEHVLKEFHGEGSGHFTNIFLRPITVKEKDQKNIFCATTVADNISEIEDKLRLLEQKNYLSKKIKSFKEKNLSKNNSKNILPNGEKYQFSQGILKNVILTNIVFPIYTQKSYIRHLAPGKWWDCLYTWDSGFIGLGLLEYDIDRAIENLNAYLTSTDNQSAFIHHGSPVPVQHYLFFEIWNRSNSFELLEHYYPRLKQYYLFLSGHLGSSSTRRLNSNLLQTWDYFYNSGGWDDYPSQYHMHKENIKNVTPVITTAHCIRIAKFLTMYSELLSLEDDSAFYKHDIEILSNALNKLSWDKNAGYYSYVNHDSAGFPTSFLINEQGENFNKGLDGAYPIVSGICNPKIEKTLLSKLKSPKKLWSKAGLSAVDQSASYYRKDGYWNGTVWMSHQWFFWKSLLDIGEYKFAEKLALKALNLWKNETDSNYRSLEHFIIETQRGAGWHAFSGLSCPIINWFNAYFTIGTINTGFDTIIVSKKFNSNYSDLKLSLKIYPRENSLGYISILVVVNPKYTYKLSKEKKNVSIINNKQGNVILNIKKSNLTSTLDLHLIPT
ncbi:MGH1-like glycoside hydrolase domain-containing protein [Francisella frigiditurris]|uniref:Trehalase family protein n=1 Tax=Francisella frigiditurris TaxID=1542390 RepID=A0A1J0KU17_9GAMM|nr:hypothetical protein [Francisella frigiditurris]APC97261.1 trehalase family protein [Francisella frigiditurris]